jgi:glycosyltransferase involved in cell wall biosynthesis
MMTERPNQTTRLTSAGISASLVIPVFNEAESIPVFLERIEKVFAGLPEVSLELVFVNDGSTDNTLAVLLALRKSYTQIKVIDLSRNFGKEAALSAGLQNVEGDVVIPIDVDLQDPPELIPDMLAKWQEGFDVVLAKRSNRDSDSFLKQITAKYFYRLHNRIAEPKIPENVGDYRLMDAAVVDALNQLPESRRFMKGLFAWVGFKTTSIEFTRPERAAGKTKFNGWKLWRFALEGFTSFSTAPLRAWLYLGVFLSLSSFLYGMLVAVRVLFTGIDVPGYASIIVSVTFIGGVQLIGIGVIGEYIGKTYVEAKQRPIFLVRKIYSDDSD